MDRVLKTITKQIVKNGVSVFFPSSVECREYFFAMIEKSTNDSITTSSTSTFKYETSLNKPSGKLLFEALCNLFCSNSKSNMVAYLMGGNNCFETRDSHISLLSLIEKMIRLSSSLDLSGGGSTEDSLENRLIQSLIGLLNSIQSSLLFKVKECGSEKKQVSVNLCGDNAAVFVHDYADFLIKKSQYLLSRHTATSFLLNCFFSKLVYNFILWLGEIPSFIKLNMATKFTEILISFYDLSKSFSSIFKQSKVSASLYSRKKLKEG